MTTEEIIGQLDRGERRVAEKRDGEWIVDEEAKAAILEYFRIRRMEPVEHRGFVPPWSVVLPGTRPKEFPAGTYDLSCALIVGRRSASTEDKVSLNDALREYGIGNG